MEEDGIMDLCSGDVWLITMSSHTLSITSILLSPGQARINRQRLFGHGFQDTGEPPSEKNAFFQTMIEGKCIQITPQVSVHRHIAISRVWSRVKGVCKPDLDLAASLPLMPMASVPLR